MNSLKFSCLSICFDVLFVLITVKRRVHITEETLQHLNGAYQVEVGDGGSRDPLLTGRKTFLVIDPHKPNSISRRPQVVRAHVCQVQILESVINAIIYQQVSEDFVSCTVNDEGCWVGSRLILYLLKKKRPNDLNHISDR